jgi:hypothetical protein
MSKQKKTRLMALCPCCGGEVTRPMRYWFMLIEPPVVGAMLRMSRFHTCAACADIMLGDSAPDKAKVMEAFAEFAADRMWGDAP